MFKDYGRFINLFRDVHKKCSSNVAESPRATRGDDTVMNKSLDGKMVKKKNVENRASAQKSRQRRIRWYLIR